MFLNAKYAFSFISRACCLDCFAGHLRHCCAMSNVIRYNDLTGQLHNMCIPHVQCNTIGKSLLSLAPFPCKLRTCDRIFDQLTVESNHYELIQTTA